MLYSPERYLVTSALPYANGPLHIGHLAGAYLSADVYVRFLRLMGKDVVYVCGSDEHGAAITIRALKDGLTPKEVIDKYHHLFQEAFKGMGISFDMYHRTSAEIHHQTSQDFFRNLFDQGAFDEIESEQYFDPQANQFLADRYIKGTCPKCSHPDAYGDQCEKCGSSLSPTELINPVSTLTGAVPILKNTTHWYLPLQNHEAWLKEWISTGVLNNEQVHDPSDWKNHVLGQCKSWLEGGLQPRSMTRDLDWGVDVPHEIPGSKGKKIYVWMDAPIGYISATKQWALDNDKDWEPYWKDEKTALIHFIGKDNIVFHCLIFPAILKTHGGYILPKNVPANQFVNLEGDKLSTSRNWAVWVNDYLTDLPGKQDELRYHMIKTMPEQKDSEFTWKTFQESINSELVNNLANFINRVIVLTHKYYDGVVPGFDEAQDFIGVTEDDEAGFHDCELLRLHDDLQELTESLRNFEFRSSLTILMKISSQGNQLLQFNEPWKNIKKDEELVKAVMNLAIQIVGAMSVAMAPFMPFAADRLRTVLALEPLKYDGDLDHILELLCEGQLIIPVGHQINEAEHLFARIEDETIEQQINKLKAASKQNVVAASTTASFPPIKSEINYEDFAKLDIRIAKVLSAERVPKADRLLKLELELSDEVRTVVSGIAEHFDPSELVGKRVSYLANLAPRKLKGIESKGMILLAENNEGKMSFISPEEDLESGSIVS